MGAAGCGAGSRCPVPFSVAGASAGCAARYRCPAERGAGARSGAVRSRGAEREPGPLNGRAFIHRPHHRGSSPPDGRRHRAGPGTAFPVIAGSPGITVRLGRAGAAGTEPPVFSRESCPIPAPRSPAAFGDKPSWFRVGQTGLGSSTAPTCWEPSQSHRRRGVGPGPGSGSATAPRAAAAAPDPSLGPRHSSLPAKHRILFRRLWPQHPPGTRFSGEKTPGGAGDNRWGRTEARWGRGCRCSALLPPPATGGTGAAARSSGGEGRMPLRRGGGGRGGRGLRGGRRHLLPGPAMPGGAGPAGGAVVYVQLSGFLFPRCPPGPAEFLFPRLLRQGPAPQCGPALAARPPCKAPESGSGSKLRWKVLVHAPRERFRCKAPLPHLGTWFRCPVLAPGSETQPRCKAAVPGPVHSSGARSGAQPFSRCPALLPVPGGSRGGKREVGSHRPVGICECLV